MARSKNQATICLFYNYQTSLYSIYIYNFFNTFFKKMADPYTPVKLNLALYIHKPVFCLHFIQSQLTFKHFIYICNLLLLSNKS
jgi:hypothetical protein